MNDLKKNGYMHIISRQVYGEHKWNMKSNKPNANQNKLLVSLTFLSCTFVLKSFHDGYSL